VSGKLEDKGKRTWNAARYTAVGLEFGISVLVGWFIGDRVDKHFGWAPWGMITGTLLGFGAGLKALIQAAREIEKEDSSEDGPGEGER
jgi:F0F1-type ATP synthase assembly protein I